MLAVSKHCQILLKCETKFETRFLTKSLQTLNVCDLEFSVSNKQVFNCLGIQICRPVFKLFIMPLYRRRRYKGRQAEILISLPAVRGFHIAFDLIYSGAKRAMQIRQAKSFGEQTGFIIIFIYSPRKSVLYARKHGERAQKQISDDANILAIFHI